MTIEELNKAVAQKSHVLLPASDFKCLLEKAYHVANTEDAIRGSDQKARLSICTERCLELAIPLAIPAKE